MGLLDIFFSQIWGLLWCVPRRGVFFCLRVLFQKMSDLVISGQAFLKKVEILLDLVDFINF